MATAPVFVMPDKCYCCANYSVTSYYFWYFLVLFLVYKSSSSLLTIFPSKFLLHVCYNFIL